MTRKYDHSRIGPSENDTRELQTLRRFLIERAAHQELERATGRQLPFRTATVPNEWWDPRGEFTEGKGGQ